MAQGFVYNLNLFESNTREKDSNILDNLAGAGISEDISLFTNNLRNIDFLRPGDIILSDPVATLFKLKSGSKVAFTNGTRISHGDNIYTVTNSNAETEFELIDDNGVKLTVGELQYNLIRSTTVTFENMSNLDPLVLKTIVSTQEEIDAARDAENPTVAQKLLSEFVLTISEESPTDVLEDIELYNSRYLYARELATFKTINKPVEKKFRVKNSIFITNKDNVDVTDSQAPGAFISNSYGQVARVGGNNINPWDTVGEKTKTVSTTASIGNLVVENPSFNGVAIEAITEGPAINFTHRIPVNINGVEYSLLCTDSDLSKNIIELYNLFSDTLVVDEGVTVTIELETQGIPDSTTVPYTVIGIQEGDLAPGSSPLQGDFTVISNRSFAIFNIKEDLFTEGDETLTLSLNNGRGSITIDIKDTSETPPVTNPVYTLGGVNEPVPEGTLLVVTLVTQNVPDGNVPYTITGVQSEDIDDAPLTGSFNLVNGEAQVAITITADAIPEGQETLTLTLDGINESLDIVINDTSTE